MSLSVEEPSPLPTGNRRNRNFLAFALARLVGTAEGEDLASEGLFILAFALTVALRVEAAPTGILFIGNSLTYRQKGIYFHLEKLAASAVPAAPLQTEKAVKGGASLRLLWE